MSGESGTRSEGSSDAPPVIITSRMSSQRFPGKALAPIMGRPLLSWVVQSCRSAQLPVEVLVATSDEPSDRPIRSFCDDAGIDHDVGPLHDVARRLQEVAQRRSYHAFVRISGDSPLLDPRLIDFAASLFERSNSDLVTNVSPRTFPRGQSVEIVRVDAMARLLERGLSAEQQEHVTQGFYDKPEEATIVNFTCLDVESSAHEGKPAGDLDYKRINLSVDEPEDLERVQRVIAALAPLDPTSAGWKACSRVASSLFGGGKC